MCHVESSQSRIRTHVPCISRWIFNHWTTREVQTFFMLYLHRYVLWKLYELPGNLLFPGMMLSVIILVIINITHCKDYQISLSTPLPWILIRYLIMDILRILTFTIVNCFILMLLQKCSYKTVSSSEKSVKRTLNSNRYSRVRVSDHFKIIKLNWVRIQE